MAQKEMDGDNAGRRAIDRQTLAIFWQATMENRRLFLLALLHTTGALLLTTLAPYFVGKILGSLFMPHTDHWRYVPFFVGAVALGVICNRIGFPSMLSLQARTLSSLQARCLSALVRRGISFHSNNVGGKLVSDAMDFPQAYTTLLTAGFATLLPFAVTLVTGCAIIFIHSWILGLIILMMAVFTVGTAYLDSRRRWQLRQRRLAATKAVTAHLADVIVNVPTVKTFAHEPRELDQHQQLNRTLLDLRLTDWLSNARYGNNRMIGLSLMQVAFIICVLLLAPGHPALLGVGIFGFSFTITMSNRLFDISMMLLNIEDAFLQASPMTETLMQEPEIVDRPGAQPLDVPKGAIEFKDVHFRYTDSSQNNAVFSRLSLNIKGGEKIGLVGPSGGGKSTLTRLLLRFEDINGGQIAIDGQPIDAITQSSLRQAISYVPQEPLLFHRSVRENIAYGNPEASDEQLIEAARKANAHEFIDALPEGYDTIVGERGVKLSGGQRQRIAIARAILKDAPILILDEATSALDSNSEALIQDALRQLMKGRTAIVVAHRLSTIQNMDRIVVLEHGAITEQGSHAALLKRKGTYATLWARQSGGFIDD